MSIIRQDYGTVGDSPSQAMIAPVFYTYVATAEVPIGHLFIIDNTLFKATSNIAVNDPISIGTGSGDNAVLANSATEELIGRINNFINPNKYLRITKTYTTGDIIIYSNGNIIVPQSFSVPSGTYTPTLTSSTSKYVNLGSVSDEDVKKVFPYANSTPGGKINLGFTIFSNGTTYGDFVGAFLFCGGGSGGGTAGYWYFMSNGLMNTSGAQITLSTMRYFLPIPKVNPVGYLDIMEVPSI